MLYFNRDYLYPGTKASCLVAFLATATYSSYVFLPHYLGSLLHYLGYSGQNWGAENIL